MAKTVLVTGATSGIGLIVANELKNKGFNVFGTSRNPSLHQGSVSFELLPLDLISEKSIRTCVELLLSKSETIDILINNAGIGICGSAEETSDELAYKQFQANFRGSVCLTKAILPIMRQRRQGKIITIGSLAGLIGVPFQSYYAASKHAVEGFFKSLRFEVKSFGIDVSVVEPGFFKTNLHQAFEYAEPTIRDYDLTRNNALKVFSTSIEKAPTPEPIAKVVLKIIHSKNPYFSYRVGRDAAILPIIQFAFTKLFEFGTRKKFNI